VEPELGVVEEVVGGQRNALWLWHAPNKEIVLTSVQLGKRIGGAIELRKLQLVRHRHNVIAGHILVISLSAVTAMLLSVVRWIAWRRGAAIHIGGELHLRKVDALDGR
jgi:hypothetical protein